jgi:FkbM family methyltransferase
MTVEPVNLSMGHIKGALKKFRASQPFNYIASSAFRFVATAADIQPEFIIKHLPKVGLVKSRLPNGRILRFWSRGDDFVSNQVYWRDWSGYEPEASTLFFRLAERATVIFDIGAHIGFYALLAGHANPAARVYAFEPLPDTYARLQRNIRVNRLANVHCVNSAVGEVVGAVEFYRPKSGLPCSAGMSFEFYRPWAADVISTPVSAITADCFAKQNGIDRVDLVKIDTESTEPQVLRGMAEVMERDHPTILCEVLKGCGSEQPLEEILAPLGYKFYLLTSKGPVPSRHITGDPVWLNYLFTTLDTGDVSQLCERRSGAAPGKDQK